MERFYRYKRSLYSRCRNVSLAMPREHEEGGSEKTKVSVYVEKRVKLRRLPRHKYGQINTWLPVPAFFGSSSASPGQRGRSLQW